MTLREIGTRLSEWFADSVHAVTTESILDWPVSVVLAVLLPVSLLVCFEIAFRRYRKRLLRDYANWRRAIGHNDDLPPPRIVPADPVERLEWANRTGRYAPGAEKEE